VGQLVESFLAGVPSPRHRLALDCVAHARLTTEGLLGTVFGARDGEELFSWMRGLSFIEHGPYGLYPHDLARRVIHADLRWRDPAAYREVHAQVREHVVERIWRSEGRERGRALADLIFLHRENPAAAALWDWKSLGEVYADRLRGSDAEAVVALVERYEGPESAAIARHWLDRQPAGFYVFRGRGPELLGFAAHVSLHEAEEEDLAHDPATRAVWAHAQRHGTPRPQDELLLARFLVDRDAYQAPSRSLNAVTMRSMQEWLGRPRLAWYYIAAAEPEAMAPLMDYIHFERVDVADFEVGGRIYGVFARDWRRDGGVEWLERMGERELGDDAPAPDAEREAVTVLALSQSEFADAVRSALRNLHRPSALAANPLIRTRVVRERESEGSPPDALRELLQEAVDALRRDELLGLPVSTYRGHLARGLERVADWLWQRELYGAGG
jgi:hypothetical protein